MSMTGDLIKVEDQLDEYFAVFNEADTEEAQQKVETVLKDLIQEHSSRVDSIVSWFNRGDSEIAFLKAQRDAAIAKVDEWERKQRTVRRILAAHMEQTDQKRLSGRTHKLTIRKGCLSVDILDESKIPLEYRELTVKIRAATWAELRRTLHGEAGISPGLIKNIDYASKAAKTRIDKEAIREALDSFEEVPGAVLVEGPPTVVVDAGKRKVIEMGKPAQELEA